MNKLIFLGPIIALIGFMVPNLAQAHTQAYEDGYQAGDSNANNNLAIDTDVLHSHSKHWQAGYNDGWNNAKNNINQQSQAATVNIRGNDNRVNINQGQAVTGDSSGGGSGSGSDNPECVILCGVIH